MRFYLGGPRIMGLRTGVSFGPEDFSQGAINTGGALGGFVYVIRGSHGLFKVGSSTNPTIRLAALQTGSPHRLEIAYTAAPRDRYEDVETGAHAILDRYRQAGEWFDCPFEVAVAAISASAARLGTPIASIPVDRIDEVIQRAAAMPVAGALPKRTGVPRFLQITLVIIGLALLGLAWMGGLLDKPQLASGADRWVVVASIGGAMLAVYSFFAMMCRVLRV